MKITGLLSSTLVDLYVNGCCQYKTEPLQWIGGTVGLNMPHLHKLKTIDLGNCPATDKGICAIAVGCHRLTFLNLQDCNELTDQSIIPIVKANNKLKLLNLSFIHKLTNKSMLAIAKYCPELTSLNISKCINLTDKESLQLLTVVSNYKPST